MILLITASFIATIIMVVIQIKIVCEHHENSNEGNIVAAVIGYLIILLTGIYLCDQRSEPKAIDVYQGKTILEVTYRDGVPIDSVVIFKLE